jgi:hypothetical protein
MTWRTQERIDEGGGGRAANRIGPFAVLPFPQSDQIEAVESHRIDHVPFRYGDPTLLAGLRRTLGRGAAGTIWHPTPSQQFDRRD